MMSKKYVLVLARGLGVGLLVASATGCGTAAEPASQTSASAASEGTGDPTEGKGTPPSNEIARGSSNVDYNLPGTCPGAVGPNCSLRTAPGWPVGNTCEVNADDPTLVDCDVSLGSLAHDTCCGQFPNGKYCNGPGAETSDCTEAWNRAQNDYATNNYWRKTFRPGVRARSGWAAINQSNSESAYWSPSQRDFGNDGLCIPDAHYTLAEHSTEAWFCCGAGSDDRHCG